MKGGFFFVAFIYGFFLENCPTHIPPLALQFISGHHLIFDRYIINIRCRNVTMNMPTRSGQIAKEPLIGCTSHVMTFLNQWLQKQRRCHHLENSNIINRTFASSVNLLNHQRFPPRQSVR